MAKLKIKILDVAAENGRTVVSVEFTRNRKTWKKGYYLKTDRPVTTEQLIAFLEDLNPQPPMSESALIKDIKKNIGKEFEVNL